MPPPRNREREILAGLGALGLVGAACLAWRAVGWFGVGLLGLLVLFIAVRVELEGNRPIGPQMTPDLHASQYPSEGGHAHAERAGRLSERKAVSGFGLFVLL